MTGENRVKFSLDAHTHPWERLALALERRASVGERISEIRRTANEEIGRFPF